MYGFQKQLIVFQLICFKLIYSIIWSPYRDMQRIKIYCAHNFMSIQKYYTEKDNVPNLNFLHYHTTWQLPKIVNVLFKISSKWNYATKKKISVVFVMLIWDYKTISEKETCMYAG